MQLSFIKVGHWYKTKIGVGKVEAIGDRRRKRARINIVAPIPHGSVLVAARDVLAETEPPKSGDDYERVASGFECPDCGEDDIDCLLWIEDDVLCRHCQRIYEP
jgi:hypothetical protein